MGRYILFIVLVATALGCEERSKRYITFEDGRILAYSLAYCRFGVLLNNDGNNLLGPDSKVIECTGYIYLTEEEAKKYDKYT